MITSMTGYGEGKAENNDFKISIEMKSVNNRYLDINVRLPRKFNKFEDDIKYEIKKRINRGKIDVFINLDKSQREDIVITTDFNLLDKYVDVYNGIIGKYDLKDRVDLNKLVRIQDAFIIEDKELNETSTKETIMESLNIALNGLVSMRAAEGKKLKLDILEKLDRIEKVLKEIEEKAPSISINYQEKMKTRILELLGNVEDFDQDKLNMEVAIFADKKDINEELVRLSSHLIQLKDLICTDGAIGRTMDFLLQEINREVNTIGSKSPDYDISNSIVELKSEFEKIREQIQNIE